MQQIFYYVNHSELIAKTIVLPSILSSCCWMVGLTESWLLKCKNPVNPLPQENQGQSVSLLLFPLPSNVIWPWSPFLKKSSKTYRTNFTLVFQSLLQKFKLTWSLFVLFKIVFTTILKSLLYIVIHHVFLRAGACFKLSSLSWNRKKKPPQWCKPNHIN